MTMKTNKLLTRGSYLAGFVLLLWQLIAESATPVWGAIGAASLLVGVALSLRSLASANTSGVTAATNEQETALPTNSDESAMASPEVATPAAPEAPAPAPAPAKNQNSKKKTTATKAAVNAGPKKKVATKATKAKPASKPTKRQKRKR
jgi:hypothetical protein